jgi:hypothetical protein
VSRFFSPHHTSRDVNLFAGMLHPGAPADWTADGGKESRLSSGVGIRYQQVAHRLGELVSFESDATS